MLRSRARDRNERGFTLVEALVVVALILSVGMVAYPLMTSQKSKAKAPGTQQAATEAVIAIRDYQRAHNGDLPTTTAEINGEGYAPQDYVVMASCYNWSNGAAHTGRFMVRTYASDGAGGIDEDAQEYLFDSGTDSAPHVATHAEVQAKFCSGEDGSSWPSGGAAHLVS